MRPIVTPEIESLARDYLTEVVRGEGGKTDPFDRLVRLTDRDTESAWQVMRRLVDLAASDVELAIIGAGPLETILVSYPGVFVARATDEAAHSSQFRRALDFVEIGDGEIPLELLHRLNAARGARVGGPS